MDMRTTMGINLIGGEGGEEYRSEYRGERKEEEEEKEEKFSKEGKKDWRKIGDANLNWQAEIPGWHNVT